MRSKLSAEIFLTAALGLSACSAKLVSPVESSGSEKGASPVGTPVHAPFPSLSLPLQALSFKMFTLPILNNEFELLPGTESVHAFSSLFDQSITFLSLERSKNIASYFWRVNARKYKLDENGFSAWSALPSVVNLFPECDDPTRGNGVSNFLVKGISDKFRVPGFSADSLPDNLTHVEVQATCRSESLGEDNVIKTKVINLATLTEDTEVELTPVADQKNIKCVWSKEKLLVSATGQLYNYRLWSGPSIPGNFTTSGPLALGHISECVELDQRLQIKTQGENCYTFDLDSRGLFSSSCVQKRNALAIRPFETLHLPYVTAISSSAKNGDLIYGIQTGNDRHEVTFKSSAGHISTGVPIESKKNDTVQELIDAESGGKIVVKTESGLTVQLGREQSFGQRIFAWSADKRSVFLSSPIISMEEISKIRFSNDPLDAEPKEPFVFSDNFFNFYSGERQSLFQFWKFPLRLNFKPDQFKIYETGSESSSVWQPWSDQTSFSNNNSTKMVRLRFADTRGFKSEEYLVGRYRSSNMITEAYIKALNIDDNDNFGSSISLSGDTLAVGAPREDSNQTTITNGTGASSNNSANEAGAVHVYRRSGSNWSREAYVKAANAEAQDFFGSSVSLSGDTLAVGAPGEDSGQTTITNGTGASSNNSVVDTGAVYVYRRTERNWSQEAFIKATNSDTSDLFGSSISLSGDTLAVGAPYEDSNQTTITNGMGASNNNSGVGTGAVYVYRRTGNSWSQEAYIKAANTDDNDDFGSSISLSGDTLAVGAPREDSNQTTITNGTGASSNNSAHDAGALYVYRRTGTNWSQEAYIKAVNADPFDFFGSVVSLSGDTLAVGAPRESSNQTTITNGTGASGYAGSWGAGAVYVYRRTGSAWFQEAYVKAANADVEDQFGSSISLSGDTLAVGAPRESSNQTAITNGTGASSNNSGVESGAVYVYRRVVSNWMPRAYVKAANADVGDNFGSSISLSGDTLAVGAPYEDSSQTTITNGTEASSDNSSHGAGAVYIYRSFADRTVESLMNTVSEQGTGIFSWVSNDEMVIVDGYKVVYGTTEPNESCTSGNVAYVGSQTTANINFGTSSGSQYYVRICGFKGENFLSGQMLPVFVDTVAPTVTGIVRGSSSPVSVGDTIKFTVTFSELVKHVTTANFTLTDPSGTGGQGTIESVNCNVSEPHCAVSVRVDSLRGNLRLDLSSKGTISDLSGNPLQTTRLGDDVFLVEIFQGWKPEAYLKDLEMSRSGEAISLSGDTLVVGGISSSIEVYRRTGAVWSQEANVKAANADPNDGFGLSVAVSGDTIAVGAPYEDSSQTTITNGTGASNDNSEINAGAVYVYRRAGSTLAQEAYVKAANREAEDNFGVSVALSGDNLAVGAKGEDSLDASYITSYASSNNDRPDSGAVYVYRRSGKSWAQEAYLKAVAKDEGDHFGHSVSLSGDTLVVGVPGEDSGQSTIVNAEAGSFDNSKDGAGAVVIFRRSGASWSQEAYVKAANANYSQRFGSSISISGDTLTVGAPGEQANQTTITNGAGASNDVSLSASGAVYVYRRTGTTWAQEAYVKAANANEFDGFGSSVSISGDTLAVGAPGEDSNQTIITNGTTAGASNSASDSGAVYVYRRTGSSWAQEAFVKAANANLDDGFGVSVSLSGDTLAVGAPGEDSNQTIITNGPGASADNNHPNSGAVYIYRNRGRSFDPQVSVSAKTSTSITLTLSSNLGVSTMVKIAPASAGTLTPIGCDDPGAQTFSFNLNTYTYSGLTPSTEDTPSRYGFRVCASDGTDITSGSLIWDETLP